MRRRRPRGLNDQESGDVKQYICARPLHHDVAVTVDWPGRGQVIASASGMGRSGTGDFGAARGVGK